MARQSFEVKSDSSNCDLEATKQDSNYNDSLNLFLTNVPLLKACINNHDYKNFFILLQKLISDGAIKCWGNSGNGALGDGLSHLFMSSLGTY
jgi:hypothetical protein